VDDDEEHYDEFLKQASAGQQKYRQFVMNVAAKEPPYGMQFKNREMRGGLCPVDVCVCVCDCVCV
jgi:hypothetical protein